MSCKLNERNEQTKETIHLLVTSLCTRDCKYCCNKQYDLNDIPYVTDEELREAKHIFITGGEPFAFANPNQIAHYLKWEYENIEDVFVYTNVLELWQYLELGGAYGWIDGVTVSIKNSMDQSTFEHMLGKYFGIFYHEFKTNYLYVFGDLWPEVTYCFEASAREWQEDFQPDPHSIFRKL